MRKLTVTFVCENRHAVESVTVDLTSRGEVTSDDIWELQTKDCQCKKCGSKIFTYHTRYK
ncbi:MAG: hypothetical protein PHT62_01640 [Desulfotomaculaceae bacterium]|nr:hypothetical protein [Desulfotomaculaceae bacterium]